MGFFRSGGALPNVILTALLFNLLLNCDFNQLQIYLRMCLGKVSNWYFGTYLVSWIFDATFYPILNNIVSEMSARYS